MIPVSVRWRISRDLPAILRIERASFQRPWTELKFARIFGRYDHVGMVAESFGRVVGFMVYRLHKNRIELLNFAVDPGFRRHGVGRQMVAKLVAKLDCRRRDLIELGLDETNLGGQLFFRSLGFRATEIVRKPFTGTDNDAYVMQYRLAEPIAAPDTQNAEGRASC